MWSSNRYDSAWRLPPRLSLSRTMAPAGRLPGLTSIIGTIHHESPFMSMITLIPTVWITTITYNYLQFFLFLISTSTIGTGTGIGMISMISSSSSRRSWGNLTTTVAGGLDCGRIFGATAIDGFPPSPQPPSRSVHLHKAPVLLASTHIS